MEEKIRELKIGSKKDMLANAEDHKDKTLTLKGLEKQVNDRFKAMEEKIKFLERRIEIVKKCLKG